MKSIARILGAGLIVPGIFVYVAWRFVMPQASDSTQDLFKHGEFLSRESRWDQSREVLREFLQTNPEHPGAHFYLGRSYLLWEDDFRPAIAEGELQTALALYHENGGEHFIERFTDDYFEHICNIESAKVCQIQFIALLDAGIPPRHLAPIVERASRYVEAARKIDPDHIDIAPYTELVNTMAQAVAEDGRATPR